MGARRRHDRAERGGLRARPFGDSVASLDVDVGGAGQARAMTGVLSACLADDEGERLDQQTLARWTLAQRLQGLIAVRLAGGAGRVGVGVTCPACGGGMELDIELARFIALPGAAEVAWRSTDGEEVIVRLPRGEDQERWSTNATSDPFAIATSLVVTIDGAPPPSDFRVPPTWLPGLDDALEAHDPLTVLALGAECPDCAVAAEHEVDLGAVLLREIGVEQRALLDDVCRLAAALHWSEVDILALPRWRRVQYLARIDAGSLL